jgi:hypothetical protein
MSLGRRRLGVGGYVEQAHEQQSQQQVFGHDVLLVFRLGLAAIKAGAHGAPAAVRWQCGDELWRNSGNAPRRDLFTPDLG